jgi:hypothetical protein
MGVILAKSQFAETDREPGVSGCACPSSPSLVGHRCGQNWWPPPPTQLASIDRLYAISTPGGPCVAGISPVVTAATTVARRRCSAARVLDHRAAGCWPEI